MHKVQPLIQLNNESEPSGRVHPHLEIKIVDEQGQVVPRGQLGELCVRGYSVMLGYWEDHEKSQEVIDSSRWMHTR